MMEYGASFTVIALFSQGITGDNGMKRNVVQRRVAGGRVGLGCVLIVVLAGLGCGVPGTAPVSSEPLQVTASIAPLGWLVKEVGGDDITVSVLATAAQDPHMFEPTPKQMMALGKTSALFTVGTLPFEQMLVRKLEQTAIETRIVQTVEDAGVHAHDAHHGHEHGDDPHVWLSPDIVSKQVVQIADTLAALFPQYADRFHQNEARLQRQFAEECARIAERLKSCQGRSVWVVHPAYGHFLETFGLHQYPLEQEGKLPAPRQLQDYIAEAQQQKVHRIFVQPQQDTKQAKALAQAISGELVSIDPLHPNILETFERLTQEILRVHEKERR